MMRPGTTRMKRYKAPVACVPCRRRKLKCDAARPVCSRCQKVNNLKDPCSYVTRDPNAHTTAGTAAETAPSHQEPLNGAQTSSDRKVEELPCAVPRTKAHDYVGSIDFIDRTGEAIDAKIGQSAGRWRYSMVMVDAPLFQCSLNTYERGNNLDNGFDLLPSRRQADHLVGIYWDHHEPLLPLLDRKRFTKHYEALFSGVELDSNEVIFKATLNTIFALATQLQDSIPSPARHEASDGFFQRAWSLLHPDSLIWRSPSLEIIQCVILMALYLQCTEHLNQTWTLSGLAVRMSHSIGLNAPHVETWNISLHDEWFRRLAWERCVSLEKAVCWSLGRGYSMPSLPAISLTSILERHLGAERFLAGVPLHCFVKNSEIDYLTLELMMSHIKISSAQKTRQKLTEVDMNILFQFDQRLTEFEKSLPDDLVSVKAEAAPEVRRQRSLLHLRLTHARVLLYRPLLTRFCFAQQRQDDTSATLEHDFGEQTLKMGAIRCLTNAQTLTNLACECRELEDPSCSLPWWYYIFYFFIAAQHIIAALVRSEVMPESASDSFRKALSAAQSYEHLSPCIGDIVNVLHKMWQNVTGAHQTTLQGGFDLDETWNHSFDEFLKQLGVEGEYPIFDPDWPNNLN